MGFPIGNFENGPISEIALPVGGIYTASAEQQFEIGARYVTYDNRIYRYAKAGATALVQCLMAQSAAPTAKHIAIAQTAYAKTAGQKTVRCLVTTGGIAAGEPWTDLNALRGGYLIFSSVSPTPIGDTYRIEASRMISETVIELDLYEPLRKDALATAEITLVNNPWYKIVVAVQTTVTAKPCGVPVTAIAAGYFGWVQTKGLCPMIVDSSDVVVIGNDVGMPGTNAVAGAVGVSSAILPIYGRCVSVAAGDKVAMVDLNLE